LVTRRFPTGRTRDSGGKGAPDVDTAAKLLASIVALGTATFGLIGATTGDLALLFRNHTTLTFFALASGFLLIMATAYVALRPKAGWWWAWFFISFALVGAVLGCLLFAKMKIQNDRVRPTVAAEWEMVGSSPAVKIATEADDVAEAHVLWVGVTSGRQTLYSGATGPDVDGKAEQTAKVIVPTEVKGVVTIAAAIVPKTDSPVDGGQKVNCFGREIAIPPVSPAPSTSPVPQRVRHPNSAPPQAACIALTKVPTPVPTAS
jgi:hypothetical protein